MTKPEAQQILKNIEVIKAWVEGKPIEVKYSFTDWVDVTAESPSFNCDDIEFRVKPEPRTWWLHVDHRGIQHAGLAPHHSCVCKNDCKPIKVQEV